MAAGLGEMAGGVAGEIVGGMLSATGVGAALGVPAIAVSTAVVVGGAANVMAGVAGLMSSGSGPGAPRPDVGKLRSEFNNKVKPQYWKREAATNPSKYSPENLERMQNGKAPIGDDGNPMELHHRQPLAEGGTNDPSNLEVLTRSEHRLGPKLKENHPNLKKKL